MTDEEIQELIEARRRGEGAAGPGSRRGHDGGRAPAARGGAPGARPSVGPACQRRGREEFGLDPDVVHARDPETVEDYEQ